MDKNFRIWGMTFGATGDLIMGLPFLTYFEKKYPESYKYFAIERNYKQSVPFFENQKLIDELVILKQRGGYIKSEEELADSCDIQIPHNWSSTCWNTDWYNRISAIEQRAVCVGINDLKEVLTEEEMIPKLYRWFEVESIKEKVISIWPTASTSEKKSPHKKWWKELIEKLIYNKYSVYHFGKKEENLMDNDENYFNYSNELSFFEQMKLSLSTKLSIGIDNGASWVLGAYQHPSINLITNWLPNHNKNLLACAPININGINILSDGGWDNLKTEEVVKNIK